jgi:hypothetical protein
MKISSRSAFASVPGAACAPGTALATILLSLGLAGCVADPGPPRPAVASNDSRVLAADLNARLDALQRQQEPASDDVIASLERALREQREKRARAVVAAGSTSVIPAGTSAGVAAPSVPLKPAAAVPEPVVVATTPVSAPAKAQHLTKAQARAASAAAARQAAAAKQNAPAVAPAPDVDVAAGATPLPPLHPTAEAVPLPAVVHTSAATVAGPVRTPMSRTPESHMPVDELYARARELELQLQVIAAIGLYREASQRGHAPSSQRLMELYADGAPGVARDYRVAVFFKERAVQQGASFDPVWRR